MGVASAILGKCASITLMASRRNSFPGIFNLTEARFGLFNFLLE